MTLSPNPRSSAAMLAVLALISVTACGASAEGKVEAKNLTFKTMLQPGIPPFVRDLPNNAPPPLPAGAPEELPAEQAPGCHWGEVSEGFQLSIQCDTNRFVIGQPVVIYATLRNCTTKGLKYVEFGGIHARFCNFSLWDRSQAEAKAPRQPPALLKPVAVLVAGGTQHRTWARLDAIFDLTLPGKYSIRAIGPVPMRNGQGHTTVVSGPLEFEMLPKPPEKPATGPIDGRGAAVTNASQGVDSGPPHELVPLTFRVPAPPIGNWLVDTATNEHIEPYPPQRRPSLLVPPGVTNIALHCPVESSDRAPYEGLLSQISEGVKGYEARRAPVVLHRGLQWVQIDLGAPRPIFAVVIWHRLGPPTVVHSVAVQISDDREFKENVRTLFNNDYPNRIGCGAGKDLEYYETFEGKLIEGRGMRARYVRLYSAGSTASQENSYLAVEVYGLPH